MTKCTVEYVGFSDGSDRRQYHLRSRAGAETQDYTVSIAHQDFASGAARYQDGPDICYQKLQRELDAPEAAAQRDFDMTGPELAAYRDLHPTVAKRSSFSAAGSETRRRPDNPAAVSKDEGSQK